MGQNTPNVSIRSDECVVFPVLLKFTRFLIGMKLIHFHQNMSAEGTSPTTLQNYENFLIKQKNHLSQWKVSWTKSKFAHRIICALICRQSVSDMVHRAKSPTKDSTKTYSLCWAFRDVLQICILLTLCTNLSSKGSSSNARHIKQRRAVLMRTALCWFYGLAEANAAFSRQITPLSLEE